MTKTNDELTIIKKEYDFLTNKLKELSEDELKEVIGGLNSPDPIQIGIWAALQLPFPSPTLEGSNNKEHDELIIK